MWGRIAVLCVLLVGCAEQGRPLRDWVIEVEGAAHQIRLPSSLTAVMGHREGAFALRSTIELATEERGQPLTLVVPCFHGPLVATVGGVRVPNFGDNGVGEHRFVIAAELATQRMDVELVGLRNWTAYMGKDLSGVVPLLRIGAHAQRGPSARVNRASGIASVAVLGVLFAVLLTTYLLDRRRRENGAAAIVVACAIPMVLAWHLGTLSSWNLVASVLVGVSVGVVLFAWLSFVHRAFELGRLPRHWRIAMWALILPNLACGISLPMTALVDRVTAPIVIAANIYTVVLIVRIYRRRIHRKDAIVLLAAAVFGATLGSLEFFLPEQLRLQTLGSIHGFALGMIIISLALALVLGRQHVTRRRSLERSADELRHQVAERSRELADSLARLAHVPRVLAADHVIAGRYRVIRQLGAGGMGTVYEVERTADAQRLALKTLRARTDANALARFAREAQIAAALDDQHLVPVLDVGIADGVMFIVMPLVGGSLDQAKRGDNAWGRGVLAQVARGLASLHARGIVHRDLKPANVLLENGVAKIADFGLSFAVTSTELTHAGLRFGTPKYMAPELETGARAATPASDIYAFGVMAADLLGDAKHPLVVRCLDPDPAKRPSAEQLATELS